MVFATKSSKRESAREESVRSLNSPKRTCQTLFPSAEGPVSMDEKAREVYEATIQASIAGLPSWCNLNSRDGYHRVLLHIAYSEARRRLGPPVRREDPHAR